jgi:predicted nucleic-acid-binding Zn-ribbon protein
VSLKRDKVCPQCESRKLWHIERVEIPGPSLHKRPLPVVYEVTTWSTHLHGAFETFICARCGFTEWYATGLDELKADPTAGVYYIDDEPKAGLR